MHRAASGKWHILFECSTCCAHVANCLLDCNATFTSFGTHPLRIPGLLLCTLTAACRLPFASGVQIPPGAHLIPVKPYSPPPTLSHHLMTTAPNTYL